MTVSVNGANTAGILIQSKVTALTTAVSGAAAGSADLAAKTKLLLDAQMELVLHLLANGRISPATVLSTLS